MIVRLLELDWWHVAQRSEEAAVVEPVDPLEGGKLDCLEPLPGPLAPDDFGLEQADDRLGQSVGGAVADGAARGLDAGVGEALGVAKRQRWHAAVAVVSQRRVGLAGVQGLLERGEGQVGPQRARDAPADDAA